MEKIEKKLDKFLDRFEEKQIREYEKLLKKMDKLCEEVQKEFKHDYERLAKKIERANEDNRDEIRKRIKNSETSIRQFRREVIKMCSTRNSDHTDGEEIPWYPTEICHPVSFIQEFIMSDRIDFVNYYLEHRFKDKFRGDRYQSCWMKNSNGKYMRTTFEHIWSYIELVEWQFKLCFANPFEYREEKKGIYFEKFNNFLEFGDTDLTRDNLRKYLIYIHKSLRPLRK